MCIHTAILCNQTMYKRNLGHYIPNNHQLSGWWTFLNLVFWKYLCMTPSGGAIGVLVHRPLAMFHWLQLHNLTWFPLHDKIMPDVYGMSHSTNITAPHLTDVVPTWQQSCAFSSLIIKFKACRPRNPCTLSEYVHCTVPAFLHALFSYGH